MKASKLLRIAAIAAAALAAPVCAQDMPPNHFYAGASAGKTYWHPGCATAQECINSGNALRVFGGYHINDTFAAEIAFTNLGKVHDASSQLKAHAWEAVGLAFWPPNSALTVYGKFGLFYARSEGSGSLGDGSETNSGPTLGAGLEADFTRHLALRAEVQHYWHVGGGTLPKNGINAMTGGVLWRFY